MRLASEACQSKRRHEGSGAQDCSACGKRIEVRLSISLMDLKLTPARSWVTPVLWSLWVSRLVCTMITLTQRVRQISSHFSPRSVLWAAQSLCVHRCQIHHFRDPIPVQFKNEFMATAIMERIPHRKGPSWGRRYICDPWKPKTPISQASVSIFSLVFPFEVVVPHMTRIEQTSAS